MLLFQKRFHEGLLNGSVTLTFRRWDKPHVKIGGRYRCHPIGVLQVDRIDRVRFGDISAKDAQQCGFATLEEMIEYIRSAPAEVEIGDDTELFRIELHHGGDGDRVEIALSAELTPEDVEAIEAKLAKLDAKGEWTMTTLRLIEKFPQVAASKLAVKVERETQPFKVDVRKLKKLGLTQSFEIGYEISPRGKAYLKAIAPKKRRSRSR